MCSLIYKYFKMNDKKLILSHLTAPERCTATNSNFSTKLLQGSNFLRKASFSLYNGNFILYLFNTKCLCFTSPPTPYHSFFVVDKIWVGDLYGRLKMASCCNRPYRSDANILSCLWNETIGGICIRSYWIPISSVGDCIKS